MIRMSHLQLLPEYVVDLTVHVDADEDQKLHEKVVDEVDDADADQVNLKLNHQAVDADDNLSANTLL